MHSLKTDQVLEVCEARRQDLRNVHECVNAIAETDFNEDLKKIDVPTLFMHGDDDQVVPIAAASILAAKIVQGSTLKVYPGFPHVGCARPTRT